MSDDDRDYEVGYGRPPKNTRFKKGQSGNPKGRPPGAKGLRANLQRELESKVKVREGNREVVISKMEAMAKRLVANAIKGDPRALMAIMKFDAEFSGGLGADLDVVGKAAAPEADDYDILRDFFTNGAEQGPANSAMEADYDGA